MTHELTQKQKSFFIVMRRSLEYTAKGIDALLERGDFASFFDNMAEAGIFDSDTVPRPESEDEGKTFRLRHWPPVDYLMACAKWAREHSELELARSVMRVIRDVTAAGKSDDALQDNYHVWRNCAAIIGLLPLAVLELSDADLIPVWLGSRFDRDGVVNELDKGVLGPLLESGDAALIELATSILKHCLRFEWKEEGSGEHIGESAVSLVDAYWLQQLLEHQAERFGKFGRKAAAEVFREKVNELFATDIRTKWSYLFRAAIEEHEQNQEWKSVENALLSGLRDVVLSWTSVAPVEASPFVRELMRSESQILRRVGVFVLKERWEDLRSLYMEFVGPDFFEFSMLHEVYNLLKARFVEFSPEEKNATIRAIDELPKPETDDADSDLAHIKLRWLAALVDSDYAPARERLNALLADGRRAIPEHPDFLTYASSGWGHGPSPYGAETLIAFAEQGALIQRLNEFREEDRWHGPSLDGLTDALEQAIASAPDVFVRILATFKDAAPRFQSKLVSTFKRLWESQQQPVSGLEWDGRWEKLMSYFELLLRENKFVVDGDEDNSAQWVISCIADLLQAGTRDDERAYSPDLLPRGWSIIDQLLSRAKPSAEPSREAMTQAINTPRGRVLEAAFSHALRTCRLQDQADESHVQAWLAAEPLFNRELDNTQGRNFEFSTLAGAYFPNLMYMSPEWASGHCAQIFPVAPGINLRCAIDGLAYAPSNRRVYVVLKEAGVIDTAIRLPDLSETARKKLNERIVLGYLWGEDSLDSERMKYWFRPEGGADLEGVIWFLWTVRDQNLKMEQIDLVRAFLDRASRWVEQNKPASKIVASRLGLLVWVLPDARGRNEEILASVAQGMGAGHAIHEFVAELNRLVSTSPAEVAMVFGILLDNADVFYDYDDELKKLIENLARFGQIDSALRFCNRLRGLAGVPQLFDRLKAGEVQANA